MGIAGGMFADIAVVVVEGKAGLALFHRFEHIVGGMCTGYRLLEEVEWSWRDKRRVTSPL